MTKFERAREGGLSRSWRKRASSSRNLAKAREVLARKRRNKKLLEECARIRLAAAALCLEPAFNG